MSERSVAPAFAEEGEHGPLDFADLYRRNRGRVYLWASRYTAGDGVAAEDLTHDVFLKLFQKLPALDEREDIGAWLYRVTANLGISRLRAYLARGRLLVQSLKGGAEDGPRPVSPERAVEARQALAALEVLPVRERVVVCMKYLDGLSQREIAASLRVSEAQVSRWVARGLERLRAHVGAGHE